MWPNVCGHPCPFGPGLFCMVLLYLMHYSCECDVLCWIRLPQSESSIRKKYSLSRLMFSVNLWIRNQMLIRFKTNAAPIMNIQSSVAFCRWVSLSAVFWRFYCWSKRTCPEWSLYRQLRGFPPHLLALSGSSVSTVCSSGWKRKSSI